MTERDSQEIKTEEVALNRFREALGQIPTPNGEFLRGLVDRGLVRLVTDEQTIHRLQKARKTGGIGWFVCFDGKAKTAKTMIGIDADRFATRGQRSLQGSIRNVIDKFGSAIEFAESENLEWQYLEDSEVDSFLADVISGGGEGHAVLDISSSW